MNRLITGVIITIVIGGTAYTINQADVVKHFAADTGLTQQQAEQYINTIPEDELVSSYDELGSDYIEDGQEILDYVSKIDCVNYEYEWQSASLTCYTGKTQLGKLGRDEISLGQSYKKLDSDSASKDDISKTIELIDTFNSDFDFSIAKNIYSQSEIDEIKKTNSFNKAVLKAVLEGN